MSVFYFKTSGVLVRTNVSTVIITKPNPNSSPQVLDTTRPFKVTTFKMVP